MKTPESSLKLSQKGRGWLGCSWQRPVKGVASMVKNSGTFTKGGALAAPSTPGIKVTDKRRGLSTEETPDPAEGKERDWGSSLSASESREISR